VRAEAPRDSGGEGVLSVEVLFAGKFQRLLVGVVAGADERAAFDDAEAERKAELFPMLEFLGRGPAGDGKVLRRGLEVLADREDVGLVGRDIADRLFDLLLRFTEAEHDAGFGDEAAALGVAKDGAGALVAGLDADGFLEAFDGLEVVVEDVGLGVEDDVDVGGVAFEVGREDLDGGPGVAVADGANGGGPDAGAAVGKLVAGDAGDDAVAKIHFRDGVGDAGGFAEVEFGRAAGGDRAEVAGARADVAEDHHGGGAAGPAFAEVGALRALADGMEFVVIHEAAGGGVAGAAGKFGAEPRRFARGVHGQNQP